MQAASALATVYDIGTCRMLWPLPTCMNGGVRGERGRRHKLESTSKRQCSYASAAHGRKPRGTRPLRCHTARCDDRQRQPLIVRRLEPTAPWLTRAASPSGRPRCGRQRARTSSLAELLRWCCCRAASLAVMACGPCGHMSAEELAVACRRASDRRRVWRRQISGGQALEWPALRDQCAGTEQSCLYARWQCGTTPALPRLTASISCPALRISAEQTFPFE